METTLYETRAVSVASYRREVWIGWEKTEPRAGMIYLRRHMLGPVNTISEGWSPV